MRTMLYALFLLAFLPLSIQAQNEHLDRKSTESTLRAEAESLLTEWMDTFLTYQSQDPRPAFNGAVFCPGCMRVHGRIGDAVLPLMYLADRTKDNKYLYAAKRLMAWMENIHCPDGGWMNDVNVSDWNGTTVFAAIALYEALHYHGHLLDDSTRNHWKQQLLEAGEFIMNHPFIYSRNRKGMRNNNVNYSASATYALQAIGELWNRQDFKDEAHTIAQALKERYFTQQDGFLFGEGPNIWTATKNGCYPVDLGYNVEESLPNLVYYARMVKDEELLKLVERSMSTHLEFMLPDGAWDNSWGTRSFKWTYWGGRTSDGFMGGYYAMAAQHPEYVTAIGRNISLLRQATHDGLLHGGMHYRESGMRPCIHHTFGHAKALASFLEIEANPSQNFRKCAFLPEPCRLPPEIAARHRRSPQKVAVRQAEMQARLPIGCSCTYLSFFHGCLRYWPRSLPPDHFYSISSALSGALFHAAALCILPDSEGASGRFCRLRSV